MRKDSTPSSSRRWKCPYCHHACVIRKDDETGDFVNIRGDRRIFVRSIGCPNSECSKVTLMCVLLDAYSNIIESWTLLPTSSAMQFPDYVPEGIREDYTEACLIKQRSPKSAATLARRCLQAVLYDFYEVKGNIASQITQLEERGGINQSLLDGFHTIRKYGNIASHPERDISIIVDIEEGEADVLLQFIETLIEKTYIRRKQDEDQAEQLKAMSEKVKPNQGQEKGNYHAAS